MVFISICTGNSEVSCCGRKLEGLVPSKADDSKKLKLEAIENQWYITSDHPMTKDNYISFVALASSGKIQIIKQYPEWDLQLRLPNREHGMLIWYMLSDGLLYQNM